MPVWLQILVATCTVLAFLGGILAWVWKQSHHAKTIAERPYPCKVVLDLKKEVEQHDTYLSKDRKRLEDLEKSDVQTRTQLIGFVQDVKDIKTQTNQILMLLIEGKK